MTFRQNYCTLKVIVLVIPVKHFVVRFFIAAVVACVLLLTLENALPEITGSPPPAADFPASIRDVIVADIASQATRYRIPTPNLIFAATPVHGNTSPVPGNPTSPSTITIGTPIQSPAFLTQPEMLLAVVSHEFGHAVMIHRGQSFPTLLVLLIFIASMTTVLLAAPTYRGVLVLGTLAAGLLLVIVHFPAGKAQPEFVFLYFHLMTSLASLMYWRLIHRDLIHHAPRLVAQASRFRAHLPSPHHLALTTTLGVAIFTVMALWIGGMNSQRELRADIFGACATSPITMASALNEIAVTVEPSNSLKEFADTFHPSGAQRHAQLRYLADHPDRAKETCTALVANTLPESAPHIAF